MDQISYNAFQGFLMRTAESERLRRKAVTDVEGLVDLVRRGLITAWQASPDAFPKNGWDPDRAARAAVAVILGGQ